MNIYVLTFSLHNFSDRVVGIPTKSLFMVWFKSSIESLKCVPDLIEVESIDHIVQSKLRYFDIMI